MRTFKQIIIAGLALLALSAWAAPVPWPVYATGGTASGATTAGTNHWAIISGLSANGGAPVITYLNVTSDKAGSVVQFYKTGAPMLVTGVNTNSDIPCTTNGVAAVAAGDWLILRHTASDTYERVKCASTTGTTYISVQGSTPATPTALGDELYEATAAGSIPVGSATLAINGPGIYSGIPGRPLMLVLDVTSAASTGINAVCATYWTSATITQLR